MALQGIDMLCDSKWGQIPAGSTSVSDIDVERNRRARTRSITLRHSESAAVALQRLIEGVGAATRPQLLPERNVSQE
jgi:hypothetical protein